MSGGRWGLYASSVCHYCEGKATTDDHIVPRSALPRPQSWLPYWFRSRNIVPACRLCNANKDDLRTDCDCAICKWAWDNALAVFLPIGFKPRGYIRVATLRRMTEQGVVLRRKV